MGIRFGTHEGGDARRRFETSFEYSPQLDQCLNIVLELMSAEDARRRVVEDTLSSLRPALEWVAFETATSTPDRGVRLTLESIFGSADLTHLLLKRSTRGAACRRVELRKLLVHACNINYESVTQELRDAGISVREGVHPDVWTSTRQKKQRRVFHVNCDGRCGMVPNSQTGAEAVENNELARVFDASMNTVVQLLLASDGRFIMGSLSETKLNTRRAKELDEALELKGIGAMHALGDNSHAGVAVLWVKAFVTMLPIGMDQDELCKVHLKGRVLEARPLLLDNNFEFSYFANYAPQAGLTNEEISTFWMASLQAVTPTHGMYLWQGDANASFANSRPKHCDKEMAGFIKDARAVKLGGNISTCFQKGINDTWSATAIDHSFAGEAMRVHAREGPVMQQVHPSEAKYHKMICVIIETTVPCEAHTKKRVSIRAIERSNAHATSSEVLNFWESYGDGLLDHLNSNLAVMFTSGRLRPTPTRSGDAGPCSWEGLSASKALDIFWEIITDRVESMYESKKGIKITELDALSRRCERWHEMLQATRRRSPKDYTFNPSVDVKTLERYKGLRLPEGWKEKRALMGSNKEVRTAELAMAHEQYVEATIEYGDKLGSYKGQLINDELEQVEKHGPIKACYEFYAIMKRHAREPRTRSYVDPYAGRIATIKEGGKKDGNILQGSEMLDEVRAQASVKSRDDPARPEVAIGLARSLDLCPAEHQQVQGDEQRDEPMQLNLDAEWLHARLVSKPPAEFEALFHVSILKPQLNKIKADTSTGVDMNTAYLLRKAPVEVQALYGILLCRAAWECDLGRTGLTWRAALAFKGKDRDPQLLKGYRDIYVTIHDWKLITACMMGEYERVSESIRPLAQVAYERGTGRGPPSITMAMRARHEQGMAWLHSLHDQASDYVEYFMSMRHQMIFPTERAMGVMRSVSESIEAMHRRTIGTITTAIGSTWPHDMRKGVCQGCKVGDKRSLLAGAIIIAFEEHLVPGFKLEGPEGYTPRELLSAMSDDITGHIDNPQLAQLYCCTHWFISKLLELQLGHDNIEMSKTVALGAVVQREANGTPLCTDTGFFRMIESSAILIPMGNTPGTSTNLAVAQEITLVGTKMGIPGNISDQVTKVMKHLKTIMGMYNGLKYTKLHHHLGAHHMICAGLLQHYGRATPFTAGNTAEIDIYRNRCLKDRGHRSVHGDLLTVYAPIEAGGLGSSFTSEFSNAARVDECMLHLNEREGEPAKHGLEARMWEEICSLGGRTSLDAPAPFDVDMSHWTKELDELCIIQGMLRVIYTCKLRLRSSWLESDGPVGVRRQGACTIAAHLGRAIERSEDMSNVERALDLMIWKIHDMPLDKRLAKLGVAELWTVHAGCGELLDFTALQSIYSSDDYVWVGSDETAYNNVLQAISGSDAGRAALALLREQNTPIQTTLVSRRQGRESLLNARQGVRWITTVGLTFHHSLLEDRPASEELDDETGQPYVPAMMRGDIVEVTSVGLNCEPEDSLLTMKELVIIMSKYTCDTDEAISEGAPTADEVWEAIEDSQHRRLPRNVEQFMRDRLGNEDWEIFCAEPGLHERSVVDDVRRRATILFIDEYSDKFITDAMRGQANMRPDPDERGRLLNPQRDEVQYFRGTHETQYVGGEAIKSFKESLEPSTADKLRGRPIKAKQWTEVNARLRWLAREMNKGDEQIRSLALAEPMLRPFVRNPSLESGRGTRALDASTGENFYIRAVKKELDKANDEANFQLAKLVLRLGAERGAYDLVVFTDGGKGTGTSWCVWLGESAPCMPGGIELPAAIGGRLPNGTSVPQAELVGIIWAGLLGEYLERMLGRQISILSYHDPEGVCDHLEAAYRLGDERLLRTENPLLVGTYLNIKRGFESRGNRWDMGRCQAHNGLCGNTGADAGATAAMKLESASEPTLRLSKQAVVLVDTELSEANVELGLTESFLLVEGRTFAVIRARWHALIHQQLIEKKLDSWMKDGINPQQLERYPILDFGRVDGLKRTPGDAPRDTHTVNSLHYNGGDGSGSSFLPSVHGATASLRSGMPLSLKWARCPACGMSTPCVDAWHVLTECEYRGLWAELPDGVLDKVGRIISQKLGKLSRLLPHVINENGNFAWELRVTRESLLIACGARPSPEEDNEQANVESYTTFMEEMASVTIHRAEGDIRLDVCGAAETEGYDTINCMRPKRRKDGTFEQGSFPVEDGEGTVFHTSLGNPFVMRGERDRADVVEAMRRALEILMRTGSVDFVSIAQEAASWSGRSGLPLLVHAHFKLRDPDGRLLRAAILTIASKVVSGTSYQLECMCKWGMLCHRSLLRDVIRERIRQEQLPVQTADLEQAQLLAQAPPLRPPPPPSARYSANVRRDDTGSQNAYNRYIALRFMSGLHPMLTDEQISIAEALKADEDEYPIRTQVANIFIEIRLIVMHALRAWSDKSISSPVRGAGRSAGDNAEAAHISINRAAARAERDTRCQDRALGKETEAEKTAALTRAHVRTIPPADHARQRFLDMVLGQATKDLIRQAPLPVSEREAARATYWQCSRGVSSDNLLRGFAGDHQESWEGWRQRTFHVDGSTMREEERAELFAEAEAASDVDSADEHEILLTGDWPVNEM